MELNPKYVIAAGFIGAFIGALAMNPYTVAIGILVIIIGKLLEDD